jgi:hypothetical protein
MRDESSGAYGAAAGAIAIALFAAAALVVGDGPGMDASGGEVASFYDGSRTEIQVGCALIAVSAPLLIWFLATVASLSRGAGPRARLAGSVAFGCGLVFLALFLADVSTLAAGALRPENMAASPELARTLRDLEWLAIGMATFLGVGLLAAFAVLVLRAEAIWPRWLGWLAVIAAIAYALRIGTLFTTDGPFAAGAVLGLYVPVAGLAGWFFIGSALLTFKLWVGERG